MIFGGYSVTQGLLFSPNFVKKMEVVSSDSESEELETAVVDSQVTLLPDTVSPLPNCLGMKREIFACNLKCVHDSINDLY